MLRRCHCMRCDGALVRTSTYNHHRYLVRSEPAFPVLRTENVEIKEKQINVPEDPVEDLDLNDFDIEDEHRFPLDPSYECASQISLNLDDNDLLDPAEDKGLNGHDFNEKCYYKNHMIHFHSFLIYIMSSNYFGIMISVIMIYSLLILDVDILENSDNRCDQSSDQTSIIYDDEHDHNECMDPAENDELRDPAVQLVYDVKV